MEPLQYCATNKDIIAVGPKVMSLAVPKSR